MDFTIQDKVRPLIPYKIEITPLDKSYHLYKLTCPSCGGIIPLLEDGDSIYIGDRLPDGVPSYDYIDTVLMVGTCKSCRKKSYIYEFAFSTVPDPANHGYFILDNIDTSKAKITCFQAKNQFGETWIVERNIWQEGILPKGKCIVDRHVFGPYLLNDPHKVIKANSGVSRCGQSNEIWDIGTALAYKISESAMNLIRLAK